MNQEKRERNKNKACLQELGQINTSQNTTSRIKKFVKRFKERKYAC